MIIEFDAHGNDKQLQAAAAWIDPNVFDIVYGGSKGSGKSFLGCSLVGGDALIYPETHYFVARKKLNDLRKFTLPSFFEAFELLGVSDKYYRYNGQDNFIQFYNGSKIYFLESKFLPSDPTFARFGSMQFTRGWIEEAGEFEEDAKNNLFAAVGRWKNDKYNLTRKLLQTCNPAANYLRKNYYFPNKKGELEPWKKFIQALPTDNKRLAKGYLEHLNMILNHSQKERLLFGNWEFDDDPTRLCDYEKIIQIYTNDHNNETLSKKYITADVARYGSDKAVLIVWHGWRILEIIEFDISSTTKIQDTIRALQVKHSIPRSQIIADEDGVGGGVVDNLGILGFMNGSKALEETVSDNREASPNYYNLQSQCAFGLARMINSNRLHLSCDLSDKQREDIEEELQTLKIFNGESDGKIRILPKQEVKNQIGRSPDYRDAFLMRYYFELKKPVKRLTVRR